MLFHPLLSRAAGHPLICLLLQQHDCFSLFSLIPSNPFAQVPEIKEGPLSQLQSCSGSRFCPILRFSFPAADEPCSEARRPPLTRGFLVCRSTSLACDSDLCSFSVSAAVHCLSAGGEEERRRRGTRLPKRQRITQATGDEWHPSSSLPSSHSLSSAISLTSPAAVASES